MFLTILIATVILVLLALAGLGLNILFRKNGRFPDTEISTNPAMKNLGITCAKHDEKNGIGQQRPAENIPVNETGSLIRDCGYGCSCSAVES
jgi:hypothetical protein